MGKMLTAILAIAVLAGASWYALHPTASTPATASSSTPAAASGPSQPKRQLDNVRQSARTIESDADQRVKDLETKMQ